MAPSFQNYVQAKKINNQIEILADLVTETGFPIQEFQEWYCTVGVYLPARRHQVIVESWWSDAAKGGLGGAAIGGVAGGIPGALVGGGLGAIGGAAKHIKKGVQKWWNPNAYKMNAFAEKRDEAIELLHQMLLLSNEVRNDTNFAKGGNKSAHNQEFYDMLNQMISYLRTIEVPKLVGSAEESPDAGTKPGDPADPSKTPADPKSSAAPPSGDSIPQSESDLMASPEFQRLLSEIQSFAKVVNFTFDAAAEKEMATDIFNALRTGSHKWPDILEKYKQDLLFDEKDAGYVDLVGKLKADSRTAKNAEKLARIYYFYVKFLNFDKNMGPAALAAEAKAIIDGELNKKP